jgi:ribosomal protein S11
MAEAKSTTTKKKRNARSVPAGQLHIQATFNNTIITFTDKKGNAFEAAKKVQPMQRKLQLKKQLKQLKAAMALAQSMFLLKGLD